MVTGTKETPESQDIPLETGQSSEDKRVIPGTPPKTILEAEHLKAVSDERAKVGRLTADLNRVVAERDTLKSQVEQLTQQAEEATASLEETKATIADLETDLETAIEGNADLSEINKIKRELRAEKAKLAAESKTEKATIAELKKATEKERLDNAELVSWAQLKQLDEDIALIVDEFEGDVGTNFNRLKSACEKAGIKTKEGAQGLADSFWVRKTGKAEEKETELIVDSGMTSGGTGRLTMERIEKMSAEEYAAHPETKARYK